MAQKWDHDASPTTRRTLMIGGSAAVATIATPIWGMALVMVPGRLVFAAT